MHDLVSSRLCGLDDDGVRGGLVDPDLGWWFAVGGCSVGETLGMRLVRGVEDALTCGNDR